MMYNLRGLWVNLDHFIFFDVSADGEATLSLPDGSSIFLSEGHAAAVDRIFNGHTEADRAIPGLACPGVGGPWVRIRTTGAVNMALVDGVEVSGEAVRVRAGVWARMFKDKDARAIRDWLYKNAVMPV